MKFSLRLLLVSFVIIAFAPGLRAESKSTSEYIKAKTSLEKDPAGSFQILQKLKPFKYADDVRLNLLADAAMRSQHLAESSTILRDFSKATPSTNDSIRARIERVELLMLLGHLKDAKKEIKQIIKALRFSKWKRANRWHFNARALRLHHDLEKGSTQKKLARSLLILYPTEPPARRQGLAIKVSELTNAERFKRADRLMNGWEYTEARQEYERLKKIKKYRKTALWNLGVIGLRKLRDRAEESEKIFKSLASKANPYQEKATWYWARSLMKQDKYKEAFKVFDRYEESFPGGSRIPAIYYYRGWLPYDARENKKAIRGLKRFQKKYGKRGRKASFIYGFLGWAYMREKQWDKAIAAWDDMRSFGNIIVAGKALYWKAVAQKEKKDLKAARATLDRLRKKYSVSYYGILGEQLRNQMDGKSAKASDIWWPKRPKKIEDAPRLDPRSFTFPKLSKETRKEWKRVKELVSLGELQLARESLKPIRESLIDDLPFEKRKSFIHALGWFVEDFNKMWRVSAGSISAMPRFPVGDTQAMVMAYPRAYKKVVQKVSKEFDIPDYFMWSIMRQESRYKPSAISYTDAVGALQMIPKTAKKVAPDIGTVYNLRTFSNPEVGFRFSAFYLKKVLDYFDGMFVLAAASYNTGPKVISRWFHKNKAAKFPYLIEEFEYNEGRSYCRKVTEHMLRYIYLYENDEKRRKFLLDKMFPLSRDIEVPLPEEIDY